MNFAKLPLRLMIDPVSDGKMDVRSEGKVNGVIYKGKRYVRFSYPDGEVKGGEVVYWSIREPLDILTRVRNLEELSDLDNAFANCPTPTINT